MSASIHAPAGAHLTDLLNEEQFIELLEQYWPEPVPSPPGSLVRMSDADAEQLQAFFDAYGVQVNVRFCTADELGHAYEVLSLGFTEYVKQRLRTPQAYAFKVEQWPESWKDYVEAVALRDREAARRLAEQLQPVARGTELPPGIFDALYE